MALFSLNLFLTVLVIYFGVSEGMMPQLDRPANSQATAPQERPGEASTGGVAVSNIPDTSLMGGTIPQLEWPTISQTMRGKPVLTLDREIMPQDNPGVMNTCSEKQWMCTSVKKCVSRTQRCNGKDECGDGSDEIGCPVAKKVTFVGIASAEVNPTGGTSGALSNVNRPPFPPPGTRPLVLPLNRNIASLGSVGPPIFPNPVQNTGMPRSPSFAENQTPNTGMPKDPSLMSNQMPNTEMPRNPSFVSNQDPSTGMPRRSPPMPNEKLNTGMPIGQSLMPNPMPNTEILRGQPFMPKQNLNTPFSPSFIPNQTPDTGMSRGQSLMSNQALNTGMSRSPSFMPNQTPNTGMSRGPSFMPNQTPNTGTSRGPSFMPNQTPNTGMSRGPYFMPNQTPNTGMPRGSSFMPNHSPNTGVKREESFAPNQTPNTGLQRGQPSNTAVQVNPQTAPGGFFPFPNQIQNRGFQGNPWNINPQQMSRPMNNPVQNLNPQFPFPNAQNLPNNQFRPDEFYSQPQSQQQHMFPPYNQPYRSPVQRPQFSPYGPPFPQQNRLPPFQGQIPGIQMNLQQPQRQQPQTPRSNSQPPRIPSTNPQQPQIPPTNPQQPSQDREIVVAIPNRTKPVQIAPALTARLLKIAQTDADIQNIINQALASFFSSLDRQTSPSA